MVTQTFTCGQCGEPFSRQAVRGQRPKWCKACRHSASPSKQFAGLCQRCGDACRSLSSLCLACSRTIPGPPSPPRPPRLITPPPGPSHRIFYTNCRVCSRLFVSPFTISTCSTPCTETKARWDKAEHRHRSRARKRQAFVAPVSRRAIYERDGWLCMVCGDPVNRSAKVPELDAPVLDHVLALAAGGTHEPSNVQCAHFYCNSVKGDRAQADVA